MANKKDETPPQTTPDTPVKPAVQPAVSTPDETKQDAADQPATKQDETIPGGLYISGDRVVNAEGKEVKGWSVSKDGKSMHKSSNPLTQPKDNA